MGNPIAFGFVLAALIPVGAGHAQEPAKDAKSVFQAASPAVMRIEAMSMQMQPEAAGTGFFVSEAGLFATNFHVVKDGYWLRVTDPAGATFGIEGIRGFSEADDIIVLKLRVKRISWIPLGGSTTIEVGSKVFAIGNPQGLDNTLSEGIISGKRELENDRFLLQTTAAISPGSSGGPLLDERGRAVGVTSFYVKGGQNLNFAIPTAVVRALIDKSPDITPLNAVLKKWELPDASPSPAPAPQVSEYQDKKSDAAVNRAAADLPASFRVRLLVSCDDASERALLESKFRNALRRLSGVEVIDGSADYEVQLVAIPSKDVRGNTWGTIASVVILDIDDGFTSSSGNFLVTKSSVCDHGVYQWGRSRLDEAVDELVAGFDTKTLERERKRHDGLRQVLKAVGEKKKPNP